MKANPLLSFILILFFTLGFSGASQLQAQNDDDEEEYSREFVWGINKNTNGGYIGGLNLKFSNRTAPGVYRTMGFEVVNVKHPKETRYLSRYGGGYYILNKINYLYALRFSMGQERVLFKKGPQQGVQVNAIGSFGPTIGLVSPYFVEYGDGSGNSVTTGPYIPFDPTAKPDPVGIPMDRIYGPGRPFQGIAQSAIAPGVHARAGISFEFGTFKSNVSGIEVGVMAESYLQKVRLLTIGDGQWFFPSAYITLFHGSRR